MATRAIHQPNGNGNGHGLNGHAFPAGLVLTLQGAALVDLRARFELVERRVRGIHEALKLEDN